MPWNVVKRCMSLLPHISSAFIFSRPDNLKALSWAEQLTKQLKKHRIELTEQPKQRQAIFVLGGDGTILEAVRKFHTLNPLIIGMNLGSVGFLASVREPKKFNQAIEKIIKGEYWIVEKMMLEATITRNKNEIATIKALNEILIQNPLGMVKIDVHVANHPLQEISGTGVLIATPTGSTGYNLSAHGPLVMPTLDAIIMSEIMDHNIPTPSIVVDTQHEITLHIKNYRERELLSLTHTQEKFDVILSADGETLVPLQKNDRITVRRYKRPVRFIEFEHNYFLKSLQEKFSFA